MFQKAIASKYFPGVIAMLIALLFSLVTYQDYGLTWDEPIQRTIGMVSYDYIFNNDPKLITYIERDHGVGFELVLLGVEKLVGASDFRDIFLARHLASNIFYLLACFTGYLLALRLFKNKWMALVAFALLLLHPRLYAHSFFNSKDTPLVATYIIALFFAEKSFRTYKKYAFGLLGLVCGYATSIRILGIFLIVCILGFLFFDLLFNRTKYPTKTILSNGFLFLLGAFMGVYIFWPTLWASPFANFIESYKSLSHFRWDGDLLLFGVFYKSTALPWFYLPSWFAITTPILWLLLGSVGLILVLVAFISNPIQYLKDSYSRNWVLYCMCFLGPVVAVITLHSVVYDDWRHVYFIYPSFVMLVLYAIHKLSVNKLKLIVPILVVVQFVVILFTMIKTHPFHQVYFNELIADTDEYRRKNFDYDYWGSSYKQALEAILQQDKTDSILVNQHSDPLINNIMFLPASDRNRIKEATINEARYYITTFRGHPQDYDLGEHKIDIKVGKSTIVRTYILR